MRHWRGECSLAVSYWLNGWLATVATLVFAVLVSVAIKDVRQPWIYLIALLLVWAVVLLAMLWQTVGVWRSATRARQRHGSRLWPTAAQVMLVLGLLANASVLHAQAVPTIRDAIMFVHGDPAWGPHGVRILRGGTELEVSGPLAWGVAQQLELALVQAPNAHVLHLDSVGGRISVALNLADIIREHRLDTYVAHLCASACTLAYLAGQQRWVGVHGKLGFHSASLGGTANPLVDMGFRRYYQRDGLPAEFLDHVFRTSPKELWFPSLDELLKAHVATGIAADGTFAMSGVGLTPDPHATERELLALPLYAALRGADPDWAALMATWDRTVSQGETITQFAAEVHAHVAHNVSRLLPVAPDGALLQFADVLLQETATIQRTDPEACWSYVRNGRIELRQYLTPAMMQTDLAVSTRVLNDAVADPQPRLTAAEKTAVLRGLFAAMRQGGQDPDQALAGLRPDAPHARVCPALAVLIRAAVTLGGDTGVAPLRALFTPN